MREVEDADPTSTPSSDLQVLFADLNARINELRAREIEQAETSVSDLTGETSGVSPPSEPETLELEAEVQSWPDGLGPEELGPES